MDKLRVLLILQIVRVVLKVDGDWPVLCQESITSFFSRVDHIFSCAHCCGLNCLSHLLLGVPDIRRLQQDDPYS